MGMMFRRRRPVARLATGAATAGVAYHMGKKGAQNQQANEQAQQADAAAQQPPAQPPQYAPQPPPPAAPAAPADDSMAQLEKLAEMHGAGVLNDEEFAAAKARVLGI